MNLLLWLLSFGWRGTPTPPAAGPPTFLANARNRTPTPVVRIGTTTPVVRDCTPLIAVRNMTTTPVVRVLGHPHGRT